MWLSIVLLFVSWVLPNICVGKKAANTEAASGFSISAHVSCNDTPGCMQTNNERMLSSASFINQVFVHSRWWFCVWLVVRTPALWSWMRLTQIRVKDNNICLVLSIQVKLLRQLIFTVTWNRENWYQCHL